MQMLGIYVAYCSDLSHLSIGYYRFTFLFRSLTYIDPGLIIDNITQPYTRLPGVMVVVSPRMRSKEIVYSRFHDV